MKTKYLKKTFVFFWMILYFSFFIFPNNNNLLKMTPIYKSIIRRSKIAHGKTRLSGYVLNHEGNPLKNAFVTASSEDRTRIFKTKSNEKGEWILEGLGVGWFQIDVNLKDYYAYKRFIALSHYYPRINRLEIFLKKPIKEEIMEQYKQNGQLPDVAIIILEEKLLNGEKLFIAGKYDKALLAYNYVLDIAPEIYSIIYRIADCYRMKGEEKRAIELYKKAIEMAIDRDDTISSAKALGVIGSIFQEKNNMKKAIVYFKRSLDMNQKDEILAYNVAEFNFQLNHMKPDIAIKYYKMAIKIKPSWGLPYKKLAYVYLNKDDRGNAVKTFKKFLKIEPNSIYKKSINKIINPKKLRRRRR